MCGIYGVINKFDRRTVVNKLQRMSHRGPDYMGITQIKDNFFFGHNRLAIIDLDKRSNQPFTYLHLQIVFNGEIYNFKDIREELIRLGFEFSTSSDTEVICAAYLKFGVECVKKFNGMFSFVIYDQKKNIMFGAKDRLGKKPFFYMHNEGEKTFEFASELSIVAIDNKLTVNWDNVREYFFWGYNQHSNTPFKEIKKLSAGNYFIYEVETSKMIVDIYWSQPSQDKVDIKFGYETSKKELRELIEDSVRIRMIADVPIGVFLSGGIDSSLIAAVSQSISNKQVKTYSIGFHEKAYDESIYALKVSEYLGTEHKGFYCDFNEAKDFIVNFEKYYDEPFADTSAIPMLLLSKKTSNEVTVALSGDGGDEFFAGYSRYLWTSNANYIYNLPLFIRKMVANVSNIIPNYRVKLIGEGISKSNIEEAYMYMVGMMKKNVVDFKYERIFDIVKPDWSETSSLIERLANFDVKTYLSNDINTKVDRAAMRYSLETRAPLMDYRIAEFSASLPLSFKVKKANQKMILKDILYDYVPKSFFERPKSGFAIPISDWFRSDLRDFVYDTITEDSIKDIPILKFNNVKNLIEDHMSNKSNNSVEIWKIISWIKFKTHVIR